MNAKVVRLKTLLPVLAALNAPLGIHAEESPADNGSQAVAATTGMIELGAGYVSDDSYRFGRFTGLHEQGPFLVGGLDVRFVPGRPDYLDLQGRNLGLDSRYLRLDGGWQGRQEYFIE